MSKFTAEILDVMKAEAPLNFDKATAIAERFDLKPKAVVASAIRNGIEYTRKARVSKTGEPVVTKEDLVATIADKLGLEVAELSGLDKATKSALAKIVTGLEG